MIHPGVGELTGLEWLGGKAEARTSSGSVTDNETLGM